MFYIHPQQQTALIKVEDRNFPAIEDLEPDNLPDFGPYSVLLDFSTGIENPGISYLGDNKGLDTSRFAFICVNYIGSCYGSTGADFFAFMGKNNKKEFAPVTVRDIVRSQAHLLEYLGIKKFAAVVGGSVGGMCALQFAADFPELLEQCVAIGATPLSAFGLALNHIQRKALDIENDVQIARQIATLSYKSPELFDARFGRKPNRNGENPGENYNSRFDVAGYLDYQGEIFTKRFNADSYRIITKAMDLFDLTDAEISRITAKVSLIGISSDWLFPISDVENLAERFELNGVETDFIKFNSIDGHDAFLSDTTQMSEILADILPPTSHSRGAEILRKEISAPCFP